MNWNKFCGQRSAVEAMSMQQKTRSYCKQLSAHSEQLCLIETAIKSQTGQFRWVRLQEGNWFRHRLLQKKVDIINLLSRCCKRTNTLQNKEEYWRGLSCITQFQQELTWRPFMSEKWICLAKELVHAFLPNFSQGSCNLCRGSIPSSLDGLRDPFRNRVFPPRRSLTRRRTGDLSRPYAIARWTNCSRILVKDMATYRERKIRHNNTKTCGLRTL